MVTCSAPKAPPQELPLPAGGYGGYQHVAKNGHTTQIMVDPCVSVCKAGRLDIGEVKVIWGVLAVWARRLGQKATVAKNPDQYPPTPFPSPQLAFT